MSLLLINFRKITEEKTSKLDTTKYLIEQGADINVEVDIFGRTPLIIAIEKAISEKN